MIKQTTAALAMALALCAHAQTPAQLQEQPLTAAEMEIPLQDAPSLVSPEELARRSDLQVRSAAIRAEMIQEKNNVKNACIASGADSASTIAGLASGGIVEANPLFPSSIPFMIVAGAAKCGLAYYANQRDDTEFDKTANLHMMDAVWSGAAANNILVLAGLSHPIITLGAMAGYAYYKWNQGADERVYAWMCDQMKKENPKLKCEPYIDAAEVQRRLNAPAKQAAVNFRPDPRDESRQ